MDARSEEARTCFARENSRRHDAAGVTHRPSRWLCRTASHKSQDGRRINAMMNLARSEPSVPVLPAQLDADPWLFNCPNGTVDLRTGELREHRREDLITKLCPTPFEPDAPCPTWALKGFNVWLENNGEKPWSVRPFGDRMGARFQKKISDGVWYLGVNLRPPSVSSLGRPSEPSVGARSKEMLHLLPSVSWPRCTPLIEADPQT
jgi:hypothetical protein